VGHVQECGECEMAALGSIQMDEKGRSATESWFMVVEREQNKALKKL